MAPDGHLLAARSRHLAPGTWQGAYASAQTALSAATAVVNGQSEHVYAMCRPPGHHAYPDGAAGFCFLNNSAIAAQRLREKFDRVAIIDVDLHHGNGTRAVFWRRRDVMTVSVHADPNASEQDPFAVLRVTTAGFGEIARRIRSLNKPKVIVQEGGYIAPVLGDNLAVVLNAFAD